MSHVICAFVASLRRFLKVALIWGTCSACACAATASYDILLDTDNNPATGCTLSTVRGDFTGVELVLSTTVEVTALTSTVTGVSQQRCEGGALGAIRSISNASWPVGSYDGPLVADSMAIVETFLPLAELGTDSTIVRAGVIAHTPDGGDALLGAELIVRRAAPTVAPVPALSPLLLALLAAGMGLGGAWLARRHHASVMVLGACVLLSAAGMAWAATVVMDGQTSDWSGAQRRLDGKGDNTNLSSLWFAHDSQNAYFRIDACKQAGALRGEIHQAEERQLIEYVTRSGLWTIMVDKHTVTVTRHRACLSSTVQMWGHPHENFNGKHIKDWLTDRRSLLLDDGTKITMHADGPHGVIHKMSIYDGPNSVEIDNENNLVLHQSTDPAVAQQLDEEEADGETGYANFVPNDSPGAFGHMVYRNIYTQDDPGPAPQCLENPADASCEEVPLGTSGDWYQNPGQINDLYDDTRLGHT